MKASKAHENISLLRPHLGMMIMKGSMIFGGREGLKILQTSALCYFRCDLQGLGLAVRTPKPFLTCLGPQASYISSMN